jgi:uncharacterized caspase-like protein
MKPSPPAPRHSSFQGFHRFTPVLVALLSFAACDRTAAGTARALAIGLNDVSPEYYDPKPLPLPVCEKDAIDMADIARERKFDVKTLLGHEASVANVRAEIQKAAKELQAGDIFVVSFSGHGSIVEDVNGQEGTHDEEFDQLWCLFDGQMIDDELAALWAEFKEGVRIVLYSDSCHSGSVIKTTDVQPEPNGPIVKELPKEIQTVITPKGLQAWKKFPGNATSEEKIVASVISITACEDLSKSYILPKDPNSLFTKSLIESWKGAQFDGDHNKFHGAIRDRAQARKSDQVAQKDKAGKDTDKLFKEKPWTK